jgi:hypothetical protein
MQNVLPGKTNPDSQNFYCSAGDIVPQCSIFNSQGRRWDLPSMHNTKHHGDVVLFVLLTMH